jgi:hypothetical protein
VTAPHDFPAGLAISQSPATMLAMPTGPAERPRAHEGQTGLGADMTETAVVSRGLGQAHRRQSLEDRVERKQQPWWQEPPTEALQEVVLRTWRGSERTYDVLFRIGYIGKPANSERWQPSQIVT